MRNQHLKMGVIRNKSMWRRDVSDQVGRVGFPAAVYLLKSFVSKGSQPYGILVKVVYSDHQFGRIYVRKQRVDARR